MNFQESCQLINVYKTLFEKNEENITKNDDVDHNIIKTAKDLIHRYHTLRQVNNSLKIELEIKDKFMSEIGEKCLIKKLYLEDSQEQVKVLQIHNNELQKKVEKLTEIFNLMEKKGRKMVNGSSSLIEPIVKLKENLEKKDNLNQEIKSYKKDYDYFSLPNLFNDELFIIDEETNSSSSLIQSNGSHEQEIVYRNDVKKMPSLKVTQNLSTIKKYDSSFIPVNENNHIHKDNDISVSPISKHYIPFLDNPINNHNNDNLLTNIQEKTPILCNKNINSSHLVTIEDAWIKDLNLISSRSHTFNNTNISLKYCDYCKKSFNSLKTISKCNDCGVICHSLCIDKVPIPCVPRNIFLKFGTKIKLSFSELCPKTFPMIPYIVIQCVVGLEKYYSAIKELYQLPESISEVSKLYNIFLYSNSIPILKNFDPSTIVGCLQKFLRAINDPIIPYFLWKKFEDAIYKVNTNSLINVINDLPKPNLHTLAFLCLHWRRIAKKSYPNIKIGIYNISTVLAPTVVGFHTSPGVITSNQMKKEMESQKFIMLGLLQLSDTFWNQILSYKNDNITFINQTM